MMIGTRIAASIVSVIMSMFPFRVSLCVFYQIRPSVSTLPVKVNRFMHGQLRRLGWGDVVRPSLVIHNPPGDLSEPRSMLAVLIREGDTGLAVVHLLAAEALVASHVGLASHLLTSTVVRLVVVVVGHCVFPFKEVGCCFLYPHYTILIGISQPQSPP